MTKQIGWTAFGCFVLTAVAYANLPLVEVNLGIFVFSNPCHAFTHVGFAPGKPAHIGIGEGRTTNSTLRQDGRVTQENVLAGLPTGTNLEILEGPVPTDHICWVKVKVLEVGRIKWAKNFSRDTWDGSGYVALGDASSRYVQIGLRD
jgi:hypothetical protein